MRQLRTDTELRAAQVAGLGLIYNDFAGKGAQGAMFNVLHAATALPECGMERMNTKTVKLAFDTVAEATWWLTTNRGSEGRSWQLCGNVCLGGLREL